MQAFTDLVGTATLPTHGFDIDELTDLTPTLVTAQATHDTAEQGAVAANTYSFDDCLVDCVGC